MKNKKFLLFLGSAGLAISVSLFGAAIGISVEKNKIGVYDSVLKTTLIGNLGADDLLGGTGENADDSSSYVITGDLKVAGELYANGNVNLGKRATLDDPTTPENESVAGTTTRIMGNLDLSNVPVEQLAILTTTSDVKNSGQPISVNEWQDDEISIIATLGVNNIWRTTTFHMSVPAIPIDGTNTSTTKDVIYKITYYASGTTPAGGTARDNTIYELTYTVTFNIERTPAGTFTITHEDILEPTSRIVVTVTDPEPLPAALNPSMKFLIFNV